MIQMQSMPTKQVRLATNLAARLAWEEAVADEYRATQQAVKRRASQKDDPVVADARARQDAAQAEMAGSVAVFTLRALPRSKYRQIVAAHPPRPGVAADDDQKVNMDTFGDALIEASILRVNDGAGDPVDFDPAVEWKPLADSMTDAQWTEFYQAAVSLNLEPMAVPPKRATS